MQYFSQSDFYTSASPELQIYLLVTLLSFSATFILMIPFLKLLFKLNIRRISSEDKNLLELGQLLTGKFLKMGTPIMGGILIMITFILITSIYLSTWEYFPAVLGIAVFGTIFGGIDEYLNTLGKTFRAIRITSGGLSLFKSSGVLLRIKNLVLVPWRGFEESIRIMGGQQKGLKNHYKLLMYLSVTLIAVYFLNINGHSTSITFPYVNWELQLGYIYYIFVILLLFGFATAFGITDGLDGLSAGSHSVSFFFCGIIASILGYKELALLSFVIVGAELAFLYFNIHPARVEMSDVGTVPLGMIFGLIGILMHKEVAILLIGALYIIEILSSISQQWAVKLFKKRIFLVAPIHHHFEKMGWQETKVVERFWLFSIISGILGSILALS